MIQGGDQQRHQETTSPFPKTGEKTITRLKEGSKTNLLLIQSHREGNFENFRNFNFFSIQVLNACIQQKNVYYRVSTKLKFEM